MPLPQLSYIYWLIYFNNCNIHSCWCSDNDMLVSNSDFYAGNIWIKYSVNIWKLVNAKRIASQANYPKRRITVVLRINMSKHVSNESKMQNWYVVRRITSVFSQLALLLTVWQRHFFTKLKRRVKKRNSTFKRKNSPFITQVMSLKLSFRA